jgi:putative sigma-54 modulation protein
MNIEIKTVHFTLDDKDKDYVDKKIERFKKSEDHLVDLIVTITREATTVKAEAKVNFKWGLSAHIGEEATDVRPAIDKLSDALRVKITKEKEKAQEKRPKE